LHQASTAQTGCDKCKVGLYQGTDGQSFCHTCQAGSITNTGPAVGATACTACSPGQYTNSSALDKCSECAAGSITNTGAEDGASRCTACAVGKYATTATGNCMGCEDSKYQPAAAQPSCTACEPCKNGGRMSCGGAFEGYCTECIPGRYADAPTSSCIRCPRGQYSAATNTAACEPCEAGTYQTEAGKQYCAECVAGSITNMGAATGATKCTVCTAGRYSVSSIVEVCSTCSSCPAGSRVDCGGSRKGYCSDCIPGRYADNVTSSCVGCVSGMYSNDNNLASCTRCPDGKWQQRSGRAFCDDVTPGKRLEPKLSTTGQRMVDDEGQPVMEEADCSAGKYNRGSESSDCAYCPVGYVQALGGRSSCDECSKASQYIRRMTTLQPDNQTCVDCPKYGVTCDGSVKRYNGGCWHDTVVRNPSTDTNMYTCTTNGCPDKGATEMACKQGYSGPLCALCSKGYFKSVRDCASCERVRIGELVACVLGVLMLIALLLLLARKYNRYIDCGAAFSRECCISYSPMYI
jgi:hypothetical protein